MEPVSPNQKPSYDIKPRKPRIVVRTRERTYTSQTKNDMPGIAPGEPPEKKSTAKELSSKITPDTLPKEAHKVEDIPEVKALTGKSSEADFADYFQKIDSLESLNKFIEYVTIDTNDPSFLMNGSFRIPLSEVIEKFKKITTELFSPHVGEPAQDARPNHKLDKTLDVYLKLVVAASQQRDMGREGRDILEFFTEKMEAFFPQADPLTRTKWVILQNLQKFPLDKTKDFIFRVFDHLNSPEMATEYTFFHDKLIKTLTTQERKSFLEALEKELLRHKDLKDIPEGLWDLTYLTRGELNLLGFDTFFYENKSLSTFIGFLGNSRYEPKDSNESEPSFVFATGNKHTLQEIIASFKKCLASVDDWSYDDFSSFLRKDTSPSELRKELLHTLDLFLQDETVDPIIKAKWILFLNLYKELSSDKVPSDETKEAFYEILNHVDSPNTSFYQHFCKNSLSTLLQGKSIELMRSFYDKLAKVEQQLKPRETLISALLVQTNKEIIRKKSESIVSSSCSLKDFTDELEGYSINTSKDPLQKEPLLTLKSGYVLSQKMATTFFERCLLSKNPKDYENLNKDNIRWLLNEMDTGFLQTAAPAMKTKLLLLDGIAPLNEKMMHSVFTIFDYVDSPSKPFKATPFTDYFTHVIQQKGHEDFLLSLDENLTACKNRDPSYEKLIQDIRQITSNVILSSSTSLNDFIRELADCAYIAINTYAAKEGIIIHEPSVRLKTGKIYALKTVLEFYERCLRTLPKDPSTSEREFLAKAFDKLVHLDEEAQKSKSSSIFTYPPYVRDKTFDLFFSKLSSEQNDLVNQKATCCFFQQGNPLPNFLLRDLSFIKFFSEKPFEFDDKKFNNLLGEIASRESYGHIEQLLNFLLRFSADLKNKESKLDPKSWNTGPNASKELKIQMEKAKDQMIVLKQDLENSYKSLDESIDHMKMIFVSKKAATIFSSKDLQKCFKDRSSPDSLEVSIKAFGKHYLVHLRKEDFKDIEEKRQTIEGKISIIERKAGLGKGGFKRGFQAEDATKTHARLYPLHLGSEEEMKRERDTAEYLKKVPGIPTIRLVEVLTSEHLEPLEVGEQPGDFGLMMDLFPEGDLYKYLLKDPDHPVPIPSRISIAKQITTSLKGMHDLHSIHRDLKTANVLLREEQGEIKAYISDFGSYQNLEKEKKSNPKITCTSGFAAPELLSQEKEIDSSEALDLWSLGMIMFDLFDPELVDLSGDVQGLYRTLSKETSDSSISETSKLDSITQLLKTVVQGLVKDPYKQDQYADLIQELEYTRQKVQVEQNSSKDKYYNSLSNLLIDCQNDKIIDENEMRGYLKLNPNPLIKKIEEKISRLPWEKQTKYRRDYQNLIDLSSKIATPPSLQTYKEVLKDLLDLCGSDGFVDKTVVDQAWAELRRREQIGEQKGAPSFVMDLHKIYLSICSKRLRALLDTCNNSGLVEPTVYAEISSHLSTKRDSDLIKYQHDLSEDIKKTSESMIEAKRIMLQNEIDQKPTSPDNDLKKFLSSFLKLNPDDRPSLTKTLETLEKLEEKYRVKEPASLT